MIDRFPYGRAPFWLTVLALGWLLLVLGSREWRSEKKADLVLAFFALEKEFVSELMTGAVKG